MRQTHMIRDKLALPTHKHKIVQALPERLPKAN